MVFGLVDWRVFDEFSAKAKASPQLRMSIDQGIWLIMGPSGCGGAWYGRAGASPSDKRRDDCASEREGDGADI